MLVRPATKIGSIQPSSSGKVTPRVTSSGFIPCLLSFHFFISVSYVLKPIKQGVSISLKKL